MLSSVAYNPFAVTGTERFRRRTEVNVLKSLGDAGSPSCSTDHETHQDPENQAQQGWQQRSTNSLWAQPALGAFGLTLLIERQSAKLARAWTRRHAQTLRQSFMEFPSRTGTDPREHRVHRGPVAGQRIDRFSPDRAKGHTFCSLGVLQLKCCNLASFVPRAYEFERIVWTRECCSTGCELDGLVVDPINADDRARIVGYRVSLEVARIGDHVAVSVLTNPRIHF